MAVTEAAPAASNAAAQPRSGSRLGRNIAYLAGGQLATWGLVGNVDQWSDSTDIESLERAKLRHLYE